ncbi:threonine dehydratase [Mesobacillus selenatarsenatis SF-1]|uniref:L-threonine dehydratase catabolic TdcB n=2 Tax=Mesobacillus selenatarsenatis TaxID=388741 RepID=A0A0A8X185_MESS1|nr:threonine ammonia-lyase [Mesobacillus selenatarsenatis]GAM12792.1 threonine dehydratase [Mesobacillus selenatarsenatis SF-1]
MEKLKGKVHQTPLKQSTTLNYLTNADVYLKMENLQKTGSFKLRGAMNKILSLSEKEMEKGILAASAGNHAQGVALAASLRGIKSKIYMPKHTPFSKASATKGYGAEIVLTGETYNESYQKAVEDLKQNGSTFVHAFDDEMVIAGQGTVGLEMLQQNDALDVVFAPIGGGGLISGVVLAIKAFKPSVKVIGVQAAGAPATYQRFTGQKWKTPQAVHTIADGILVKEPGAITYPIIEKYVDEVVTVTDEEIAHAIMFMLEREKMLVEGAGAAALAAILSKKVAIDGKKVGCIISGGNVDPVQIPTYKELSNRTMRLYYTG